MISKKIGGTISGCSGSDQQIIRLMHVLSSARCQGGGADVGWRWSEVEFMGSVGSMAA